MMLDPIVFDRAADRIEARGWCAVNVTKENYDAVLPPHSEDNGSRECILSALSGVVPAHHGRHYQNRLKQQLGVTDLGDVFKLNDSQSDYATGKAWAIGTLRKLAEAVRAENKWAC